MTSDKDDGNAHAGVSQLALKIQTIDSGKSYVQNETTWSVGRLLRKNSWGVSKVSARRPTDFSMPAIDARINASSSTTNTVERRAPLNGLDY